MPTDNTKTFQIGLWPTIWALIGLAILLSLGTWQISRYLDKKDREQLLAQRADKPPVEASSLPILERNRNAHRSVRLEGELKPDTKIVVKHRTYNGDPGVWLLQPFELADGGTVLVNRGWYPFEMARDVLADQGNTPLEGEVTGLLHRLPEVIADEDRRKSLDASLAGRTTEWDTLDVTAMYDHLPGPTPDTPILVVLDDSHSGRRYPIATTGHVTEPYLTSGRHLSYAVFWYAVAIALVAMYLAAGFGALGSHRRGRPRRES